MDFGRVSQLNGIDFTLPPDDPGNAAVFARLPGSGETPSVYLGGPSWGERGYVGKIYPAGTKAGDYLHHYSRQFPTIELNSTFYGVRASSLEKWRDTVPAAFRFCPKFPREITHDCRLQGARDATERFVEALQILGDRLGVSWMLLPENFGPDQTDALLSFVQAWPLPLAVELRHPDWFRPGQCRDDLFRAFEETGTIPILTDVAGRRDVLHQRVTTSTVVLRFVGNRLHPTDHERVAAWAERLAHWIRSGVTTVYLFLHQPEEELNVELAESFGRELGRHGIRTQVPRRVMRLEQGELFD